MTEAERTGHDHVILPRRLPGLTLFERSHPAPADNQLDAALAAFAQPGDTVLDPWAGTGWTARRAVAAGMRAVVADASPLAQLGGIAMLTAPSAAVLDAAFAQLASSRRVDVPLRQHIEELYATRCGACRSPVVADQFIWPRDGDAPGRKLYRCAACDLSRGGPEERTAPIDDVDLAKLGIERTVPPETDGPVVSGPAETEVGGEESGIALGEGGGPPPAPLPVDPPSAVEDRPRFASTVRPDPLPVAAVDGVRHSPAYLELRARFPVLDGREDVVEELLDLFTPRNLYALHAILSKIDAELRDTASSAVMKLALATCLLPASRLNGYPGRVASLRITAGHVRQPASRHQREINLWHAFEAAFREVRDVIAAHGERGEARFAADFGELGGVTSANVLWLRARAAVVGQYLPADGVDLILSAPPATPSLDELAHEYLATAIVLGREAAETLRLEPIFGGSGHPEGVEATTLRHGMVSAAGALKPGGWCVLVLEDADPERLLSIALAGAAAGLDLDAVIHRESRRVGDGITVHLRKPSAEDRLRTAVTPGGPLRLGADGGHLTYPDLASAIDRAVTRLLRDRGEPAGLTRVVAAVVSELGASGILERLVRGRGEGRADSSDRLESGGPHMIASLIREELWRDDHPTLVRIGDEAQPQWWLRNPELAERPLADRVEWATWSILSTAGRIDEAGFFDRIHGLFPGLQAPDEELVRACLAAYAGPGERGSLGTEDELDRRRDDHARVLASLVDYGHRLGLRAWIAAREHARDVDGRPLVDRLSDEERRVYLPLVVRAPAEALGQVDVIWYVRGRLAFLFEVDWTAMVGEPVLRRGATIPVGKDQARFLVVPAERAELLRLKIQRSPWLREELDRQNWHILKWQHLQTLTERDGARMEWLEPVLGLDPLIERGGEQLTMFGE
ncbi:MAG: hypothetical protein K5924_11655 [Chloroflexi bacterium]|nr:hypothetical protein [Chloroflexota bacterium]